MSRTRAASAATSRRRRLAAVLAVAPLLASCAAGQDAQTRLVRSGIDGTNATAGDIAVRLAYVDIDDAVEAEEGRVHASFFNSGSTDDQLVSVSSPAGEVVLDAPGGVELPSQQRVDLFPDTAGAVDITITAPEGLRRATTVPLTLRFARAGALDIEVPVRIPSERPEVGEEYLDVIERHEGEGEE